MKGIWTSRKFWAALLGTLGVVGSILTHEVTYLQGMQAIVVIVSTYMGATALASVGTSNKEILGSAILTCKEPKTP